GDPRPGGDGGRMALLDAGRGGRRRCGRRRRGRSRGWGWGRRWGRRARVLAREPRRRRGRVVALVELDIASPDWAVARPGPGRVAGAQADRKQVVVPSRLPVVGHLHLVGVTGDPVDLAGALDVTGVRVDVEVAGDPRPVDLHRG